jgi:hypothetical protein
MNTVNKINLKPVLWDQRPLIIDLPKSVSGLSLPSAYSFIKIISPIELNKKINNHIRMRI